MEGINNTDKSTGTIAGLTFALVTGRPQGVYY